MWWGWSPNDPRISAISLPLPWRPGFFHLPAPRGGRRRSRRVGARGSLIGARSSLRDELIDLLRRQVVVVAVVEPHHRRVLARAQALDLLEAEQPVRRYLDRKSTRLNSSHM